MERFAFWKSLFSREVCFLEKFAFMRGLSGGVCISGNFAFGESRVVKKFTFQRNLRFREVCFPEAFVFQKGFFLEEFIFGENMF